MLKLLTLVLATAVLATLSNAADTAPTDAQIAMITVVANTVDINAGKLAATKAHDKSVKELAASMVRDHTSVNAKATALAKKLGVTPEESDTSKSLKADGGKQLEKLKALKGAEFDKAYVDNEVAYHEAVMGMLEKTLIPGASNAELKSLLESAKPIFAAHLEHAKAVQKSLNK